MSQIRRIAWVTFICIAIGVLLWWRLPSFLVHPSTERRHDDKNNSYLIDGKIVTLVNGVSIDQDPQGSKTTTTFFGNEVTADLNGDGMADTAFLLTQQTEGTGTFYYIVAAVSTPKGIVGTNAILLGDRIAPQTTEFRDGNLIVNYADRNASDPFTTPPSVGKTMIIQVKNNQLVVKP